MAKKKLIVGITCYGRAKIPDRYSVPIDYVKAIQRAGASAVLLPPGGPEVLDAVQALVLAGGGDIDPRHYGVWVRDLGSMNGTFVGEVLVTAARLPSSGRVRVGATVLTMLPEAEETPVDLWPEDGLGQLVGGSAAMREPRRCSARRRS